MVSKCELRSFIDLRLIDPASAVNLNVIGFFESEIGVPTVLLSFSVFWRGHLTTTKFQIRILISIAFLALCLRIRF